MTAVLDCTIPEFHRFIGPKLNKVIQYSKKPNRCQKCGRNLPLQVAHKHGLERWTIVDRILRRQYSVGSGLFKVDLDDFLIRFKSAHEPLERVVLFLCKECHDRYDGRTHP